MPISDNSRMVYKSRQKNFLLICAHCDFDPYTLSEEELCVVVTHIAIGHTAKTAVQYISAIQYMWTSAGSGRLPRGLHFKRLMKGLQTMCDDSAKVITESSRAVYKCRQKHYIAICVTCKFDPYTLSEEDLCVVVSHVTMTHSVAVALQYLSAIQDMWTTAGAGRLPRGPHFKQFMKTLPNRCTTESVENLLALST
jgi:glutaredoxin